MQRHQTSRVIYPWRKTVRQRGHTARLVSPFARMINSATSRGYKPLTLFNKSSCLSGDAYQCPALYGHLKTARYWAEDVLSQKYISRPIIGFLPQSPDTGV